MFLIKNVIEKKPVNKNDDEEMRIITDEEVDKYWKKGEILQL